MHTQGKCEKTLFSFGIDAVVWISLRPHKGSCVKDVVVTLRGFDDLFVRIPLGSYRMGHEQAGLARGEGEGS